jgi:hypothetical protein
MCPQVRQVALEPLQEQGSVAARLGLRLSRQRGGRLVVEEGLVLLLKEDSVHHLGLVRQLEERSEEDCSGPLLQEVVSVRQQQVCGLKLLVHAA